MKGQILIVDDQQGIRVLLSTVFMNGGYTVKTAQNGQEALERMREFPFDLIILDNHIPILSGEEVLQQMKAEQIKIPVVLISGEIKEAKRDFKKNELIVDIVSKPFNIMEFQKMVGAILTDELLLG